MISMQLMKELLESIKLSRLSTSSHNKPTLSMRRTEFYKLNERMEKYYEHN